MNSTPVEIHEDEIHVEEIMKKVRENIRRRKDAGIYPADPDNKTHSATLEERFIAGYNSETARDIAYLYENFDIQNNNYRISSHRPFVGKYLVKGRELVHGEVRRYVDPIFWKQSSFNQSAARVLEDTQHSLTGALSQLDEVSNQVHDFAALIVELEDLLSTIQKEMSEQIDEKIHHLKSESTHEREALLSTFREEMSEQIDKRIYHLKNIGFFDDLLIDTGDYNTRDSKGSPSLSLSGDEPPMYIESVSELDGLFSHIQSVWEHLGEVEPHWSVLTWDKFTSSSINETLSDFYNTGIHNVETLFNTLERNGIDHSVFATCLEYGCGLGRVTWLLAKRFKKVTGYDISRSHLIHAREYLNDQGIQNVSLHHISKPQDIGNFPKVDLVYSVIVLQHNPPPIIRLIIQELIRALNPGGIAYLQVPTYQKGYRFSLQDYLEDEYTRKEMEMHVFPQSEIFEIISQEQSILIEVLEDTWTGLRSGERSNTFVIQKR